MKFEFATAGRIVFGPGTRKEASAIAKAHGTKALLVAGANASRHAAFIEELECQGIKTFPFSVPEEPTPELCQIGAEQCRNAKLQLVISIGGGAAIDAGKAIAALATNSGEALDYLEIIGRGKPLAAAPLPFIALPTTSGTGSEATRNAVLSSKKDRVKVSLRSPLMLPKAAIVDPELTLDLPPDITASTGLDALTQLLESFTSCKATPLTDGFCREGIPRVGKSIRTAVIDGQNLAARSHMALGSLLSGIALANSGLGVVHGFAAPIGAMFAAAHGAICAALLPSAFEVNAKEAGRLGSPYARRFEEASVLLTGNPHAHVEDGILWLKDLAGSLKIKPLRELGIPREEMPSIIGPAKNSSSMKGNPVPLSDAQLEEILHAAW